MNTYLFHLFGKVLKDCSIDALAEVKFLNNECGMIDEAGFQIGHQKQLTGHKCSGF